MPDEWATELANAEHYETLTGVLPATQPAALAPGTWVAAGTPLGFLPDAGGAYRPVVARHDGYLVATCYDTRRNRTIVAIARWGAAPYIPHCGGGL
jgi:hypothetical protein